MSARWSFVGHPLRDDMPEKWPEQIPVREVGDNGVHIYRERTEQQVPVRHRCKCSHGASTHTGGYGMCHQRPCACQKFRDPNDDITDAMQRHPAGRDLPQTADITDYLRQKGEL